jgi:hypothetical protein
MQPTSIFQVEVGGLTRSGRCFTLEKLETQKKAKGKEMVDLTETNEFLKLMKHNEYNVVE